MQQLMSRSRYSPSWFALIAVLSISSIGVTRARMMSTRYDKLEDPVRASTGSDAAVRARINEAYGRLPMYFEANKGQTDPRVRFVARGTGHTLFLTSSDAVLVLARRQPTLPDYAKPQDKPTLPSGSEDKVDGAVVRMTFVGANPQSRPVGRDEWSGKANYFVGRDRAMWRTNVPTYAAVRYGEIYPGIDVVFYGNQRELEYESS